MSEKNTKIVYGNVDVLASDEFDEPMVAMSLYRKAREQVVEVENQILQLAALCDEQRTHLEQARATLALVAIGKSGDHAGAARMAVELIDLSGILQR